MNVITQRSRLVLIAAIVVATVAVGALRAASSPTGSGLTRYSHRGLLTPRAAIGVTPVSLLSAIVARIGGSSIAATSLGGPPVGVHETDNPSVPNSSAFTNSLWLYVTVRAPALTPEATTKPIWLGNLITGALRDELFAAGQRPLFSSLVSVVLPDASQESDVGGGIGAIQAGQVFSSASDSAIRSQLSAAATSAGYTVDSIDVVHADQPAPAVAVTTSDPEAAAANPDEVITAIFGQSGTYEGEYLEVRAPDGTLVFVTGAAFRTGVGQRWVNPAYGGGGTQPPSPSAGG